MAARRESNFAVLCLKSGIRHYTFWGPYTTSKNCTALAESQNRIRRKCSMYDDDDDYDDDVDQYVENFSGRA